MAPDRIDEFIRLLTGHDARLRAYVLTLVTRWADAEDVMQQVNLVLWQKFATFRPGSNFFAWACEIARLEARSFRARTRRDSAVFREAFVDAVAAESDTMAEELAERQFALEQCLQKLPGPQRMMVRLRYERNAKVEEVARELGRSVDAVYKALGRVRQALFRCVSRVIRGGSERLPA
jgi:RNA polymerase sigma-70 factor (ECF subfamily)